MTDLVDRYLSSVRRNLPAGKADDIVAELRDVLSSRIEDREEALDRPLRRDEVAAILKDLGHPLVVAAGYKPNQFLIGPEIFPFYLFTMKVVGAVVIALMVAMGVGDLIFGNAPVVRALVRAAAGVWDAALSAAAIVTLVFAVLERTGFAADHVRNWRPDQLPPADRPAPGRWESAIEIGIGIAFILWWTGSFALPIPANRGGLVLEAAPIWADYYWPILALAVIQLAIALVKWLRPGWRVVRLVLGMVNAVATLMLIAGLHRAGSWVVVRATTMDPAEAARVAESVNLALGIGMVAVAVVMIVTTLVDFRKAARGR